MKTRLLIPCLLSLLFLLRPVAVSCQCMAAPAAACIAGPLASDGEVLNSGVTKWYSGPTAIYSDYSLKGGTLIVCGDLTVDKFQMDSGRIFIQPGARFVIGNGIGAGLVLRGSSSIYNYGTLEILRNLSLENGWAAAATPNVLINASPASVFKMQNQYFVINNAHSWFVNKGKAFFHGLITDPQAAAGSVCLGTGSETNMTVLYNKSRNSYAAPEGSACVRVSEFSQLWDTLTSYPQVNMCLGTAHRTDSSCIPFGCKPLAWGKANLFRGCNSCASIQVVPVGRFIAFSIKQQAAATLLDWELEGSSPGGVFSIERSTDNRLYTVINAFTENETYPGTNYTWTDHHPLQGSSYYRVRYHEPGAGKDTYSQVIKTDRQLLPGLQLWPNPVKDLLQITVPAKGICRVQLISRDGVPAMDRSVHTPDGTIQLRLPVPLPAGIYLLKVSVGEQCYVKKIVKE